MINVDAHEQSHKYTENETIANIAGSEAKSAWAITNWIYGDSINTSGGATSNSWLNQQMNNTSSLATLVNNTVNAGKVAEENRLNSLKDSKYGSHDILSTVKTGNPSIDIPSNANNYVLNKSLNVAINTTENTETMIKEINFAQENKNTELVGDLTLGLGISYLSGDIANEYNDKINVGKEGSKQVLSVNGILTNKEVAESNLKAIIEVVRSKGERNEIAGSKITNDSGGMIRDLIQSGGYTLGAKDINSIKVAEAIEILANNGNVNLELHSQGAAVGNSSLDLLSSKGKDLSNVYVQTYGGQKVITQEQYGLGGAVNYADSRDIVSKIENTFSSLVGITINPSKELVYVENNASNHHTFAPRDQKTNELKLPEDGGGYVWNQNQLK